MYRLALNNFWSIIRKISSSSPVSSSILRTRSSDTKNSANILVILNLDESENANSAELEESLFQNINNPGIDRLVIFNLHEKNFESYGVEAQSKIVQVLCDRELTLSSVFQLLNENFDDDANFLIGNIPFIAFSKTN